MSMLSLRTDSSADDETGPPTPPLARKVPTLALLHDDPRTDDYAWLRDKQDPAVRAYLESENAYADAIMKPTEGLQDALYKEMLARIKETDLGVPYRLGAYLYYTRTEEGQQ